MFTSQAKTGICFHYASDQIAFPTDVLFKTNFDQFSAALSLPQGLRVQSLQAERCIDLLSYLGVIRNIDRDGGQEAGSRDLKQNPFWRVRMLASLCPGLPLLIHPEIQPRDNFYFPEFLHSPIRCALTAHDDDLGVFIPARLNIYFSAQGEAEKKNVSLRGSAGRI